MERFNQIHALISNSRDALIEVKGLYGKSLSAKELDTHLLIDIKNVLENLRSALDFLAKEISDSFCTPPIGKKRRDVYFPILSKTSSATDFEARMNGCFPGLQKSCPSLYSKLESYQFYASKGNEWLVQFKDLCNENKHEQLSPQKRKEEHETRLTDSAGRTVGWNEKVQFGPAGQIGFKEGGRLTFGPGSSIGLGPSGVNILGRPVDPVTQNPNTLPGDKLEKVVWVDFVFSAIGCSALPFLKECVDRVSEIIDEVKVEMESVE